MFRCHHVFLFRQERGRPVVYAREHDRDDEEWVGLPDGGGWPIFLEGVAPPSFVDLRVEPRTALQHFEGIEDRAQQFIGKWEGFMSSTRGLSGSQGPAATNRQRYLAAIDWWRRFLADHKADFPSGVHGDRAGALLRVSEGARGDEDELLPSTENGALPELGPLEQR